MIGLRASLISLCTLVSLGAQAQTVTDLELRAAYCVAKRACRSKCLSATLTRQRISEQKTC